MLFKTAMKIVLYEKEKFLGAVVGVTLALFLVMLQSGFYLGYKRDITVILDSYDADVWIAPKGQLSFDGWDYIDDLAYRKVQGDPQIAESSLLVCGYAPWRVPGSGGKDMVQVVGVDFNSAPLPAFEIDDPDPASLLRPEGHVMIARKDRPKLGIQTLGADGVEISGRRATVVGLVGSVQLFNTAGFVLTDLDNARAFLRIPENRVTYIVCECASGVDPVEVRDRLRETFPEYEVLLQRDFRKLAATYWETNTGIGPVLLLSAVLAVLVGFLIVMSTFYISTVEKIPVFAGLRALGASTAEIVSILIFQVAAVFVFGCIVAGVSLYVTVWCLKESTISIVITAPLVAIGIGVMLLCSALGSLLSIRKLVTTDPGEAFRT
jgi:putative ABC transport system permease protein